MKVSVFFQLMLLEDFNTISRNHDFRRRKRNRRSFFFSSSKALRSARITCAKKQLSKCRNTKTQVNPSSALNRTKHHQSNPSIVPGILDSNLSRRACMHSSKFLITWSNRITSYNRIRFFNRFPSFRFYYFPGLLNLCCTRQRGLPLLFREAGFTAPSGTYSGRRPTIRDLNLHTLIYF